MNSLSAECRPDCAWVKHFRHLVPRYQTLLLDVWGVLIDGERRMPGAIGCLENLRASNVSIGLVSNTSRRGIELSQFLEQLGVPRDLYDAVCTAGDLAIRIIIDGSISGIGMDRRVFVIGSQPGVDLPGEWNLRTVSNVRNADFILAVGIIADEAAALEALAAAAARGIPLLIGNPDQVVQSGGRLELAAGMLAKPFEEFGGTTISTGKPDAEIFEACLAALSCEDRKHVLVVGDTMATDIAGGIAAGLDTLLIDHASGPSGTANTPAPEKSAFGFSRTAQPRWRMRSLDW